jgi:hypothetical protein
MKGNGARQVRISTGSDCEGQKTARQSCVVSRQNAVRFAAMVVLRPNLLLSLLAAAFAATIAAGESIAEVLDGPSPADALGEVIQAEPEPLPPADPQLPVAEVSAADAPQHGGWIQLDGALSRDPLQGELKYQWQQTGGPRLPFIPEELSAPQFWAYLGFPGSYRFSLKVKNAKGWSARREVVLDARQRENVLPVDDARVTAGAGEEVRLPGEGWRQLAGPRITLKSHEGGMQFRPGLAGVYIFEALRHDVREQRGVIVPAGPDGTFGDRRPFARLPKNLSGVVGKALLVNGGLSMDQDPDETRALTAHWVSAERFRGVQVETVPGLRAKFTAPRAGIYKLTLTVSDGRLESPPESVFIRIENQPEISLTASPLDGLEDMVQYARQDVLYRNVKLGLWGDLDRAVQMFPSRCGIALRVDGDVSPPERFHDIPLALEVRDNALIHLLTWVTRQTGTRYRRDGDRSVWLVKPLTWIKDEKQEADAIPIDSLCSKPDASDLLDPLLAHFQPIITASPGSSITHIADRATLQICLPATAKARLREIVQSLRAPEEAGVPLPELPSPAEFHLRQLLGEKTVTLKAKGRRLDFLLRDFAEKTGLATAMDPRQFPKGVPNVDVDIDNLLLRDAVRRIVEAGGFDGCSVEAPGGLWFYRGAEPYPSGELLWDIAEVQSYDLSALVRALSPLSGEAIAHAIRSRIFPETWKEPGALCFYHARTRKLIVMHGPVAQRRVVEFLYDLAERKEWALGPVE